MTSWKDQFAFLTTRNKTYVLMSFIHYVMSLTHDRMQNCNDSFVLGDTLLLYVNYLIMYWLFCLAVHDFRWCHVDFCPTCPRYFPYLFCSLHFSYLVLSCHVLSCLVMSWRALSCLVFSCLGNNISLVFWLSQFDVSCSWHLEKISRAIHRTAIIKRPKRGWYEDKNSQDKTRKDKTIMSWTLSIASTTLNRRQGK